MQLFRSAARVCRNQRVTHWTSECYIATTRLPAFGHFRSARRRASLPTSAPTSTTAHHSQWAQRLPALHYHLHCRGYGQYDRLVKWGGEFAAEFAFSHSTRMSSRSTTLGAAQLPPLQTTPEEGKVHAFHREDCVPYSSSHCAATMRPLLQLGSPLGSRLGSPVSRGSLTVAKLLQSFSKVTLCASFAV